MRASAFSKAASAWKAPSPAPVSTSTSSPLFTSAAAASGTSAMRRSPRAISRGTATFTGPRSWADGAIANGRRREKAGGAVAEPPQAERRALDRLDAGVKRAHLCMAEQGTWQPSAGGPRRFLALYALAMLVVAVLPARAATFGLDDVAESARRLAEDTFRDAKGGLLDPRYFRAVGRDEGFGRSARGLVIDTAESWGEDFPYFKDFWRVSPAPRADRLTVYALLDSPSLTGAYRFVIRPGEQTAVEVECRLFLRKEVRKLGIAPLTSMFFHGENTNRAFDDFRPEVHDSDGLLLSFASDEWLWRPLDNRRTLNVSHLRMEKPRGFGLLQRDRDFEHYQDLETHPERRASAWVEASGDWGAGSVELVEIPTPSDTNDNVVAYWVPQKAPKPGEPAAFSYTLYWYGDDPARPPGGRAVATRRDGGTAKDAQRFVIDFAGKKLAAIPADRVLHGVVTVAGGVEAGELLEEHVVKNPFTGGWRLTFQARPKRREPLELRGFLEQGGDTLTETWSYVILP